MQIFVFLKSSALLEQQSKAKKLKSDEFIEERLWAISIMLIYFIASPFKCHFAVKIGRARIALPIWTLMIHLRHLADLKLIVDPTATRRETWYFYCLRHVSLHIFSSYTHSTPSYSHYQSLIAARRRGRCASKRRHKKTKDGVSHLKLR